MRIFVAALIAALAVGPAAAQIGGFNLLNNDRKKSQEEIDRDQAIDKAYSSTMNKVPDQKKATSDPWADVRGGSQPPAVQKPGRTTAGGAKSN
jgi:hypothetical protein